MRCLSELKRLKTRAIVATVWHLENFMGRTVWFVCTVTEMIHAPAQTVHHLGHVMQMGLPRYSRPLMDRTGLAVKTFWLGSPIQWRWGLMVLLLLDVVSLLLFVLVLAQSFSSQFLNLLAFLLLLSIESLYLSLLLPLLLLLSVLLLLSLSQHSLRPLSPFLEL